MGRQPSAFGSATVFYETSAFAPIPSNNDSALLFIQQRYAPQTLTDNIVGDNDSTGLFVELYNYFAYDDGSAEKAYGLVESGLTKFAYEFNLNKPDTLRAIQIHFSKIDNFDLVNLRSFSLTVWSSIGAGTEDTLYVSDGRRVLYIPQQNGFAMYVLDTPVIVQDRFYVGWQQLFAENIQVGLDLNNSAREHMFIYTESAWSQSTVEGAPMIRPIVGKNVPLMGTSIDDWSFDDEITLYPNPVHQYLYLKMLSVPQESYADIFDLTGKLLLSVRLNSPTIDVSSLAGGLYILKLTDKRERTTRSFRFVKM